MSYTFTIPKTMCLGIKRNRQNTAVLKTVMKIILRNNCKNSHFVSRMGLTLSSTAWFF